MMWLRFLLLLTALLGFADAKSYGLSSVKQDVFFRPDGTVRVEDTRTLSLDGDFWDNEYFVEINLAPGESVRFEGVEAVDGKTPAEAVISDNEIAWKVRGADETRRFRFSYVLTGELLVAEDAARFDRQVLEPVHAPIDRYTLRLHPPAPSPEQFKVFMFTGRGRIGTLEIADNAGLATVSLAPLSEDEFVRSLVLLEADLFNFQNVEGESLETWLDEIGDETETFREASRRAIQTAPEPPTPLSPLLLIPVWVGVALMALWLFHTYQRYGREPTIPEVGPYYREPAEPIPPAAVPFVLTQNAPGVKAASPAIAATLLDFARRGFLELQTVSGEGFLGFGGRDEVLYRLKEAPADLTPFERTLWNAFEGAAKGTQRVGVGAFAGGKGLTSDSRTFNAADLRDYFKARSTFAARWVGAPRRWYETTHGPLLEPDAGRRAGPIAALCILGAAGAGFFGFSALGFSPVVGVGLLAAAGVLLLLAVTAGMSLKRWHADKLHSAKRWEAYRRFLADFSMMCEAPAEHYQLWDYHFVYATALGVSKQYLKNLKRLMAAEPDRFVTPRWLGTYPGGVIPSGHLDTIETLDRSLNTLSQIETNLTSLESALSPQTKTGGGFGGSSSGGGFSGGSSGGGGSSGMR